jgi:hypothetical protein
MAVDMVSTAAAAAYSLLLSGQFNCYSVAIFEVNNQLCKPFKVDVYY